MAGVKQFEESSTAAAEATVSESATENNQIVKEIEEKIKVTCKPMLGSAENAFLTIFITFFFL